MTSSTTAMPCARPLMHRSAITSAAPSALTLASASSMGSPRTPAKPSAVRATSPRTHASIDHRPSLAAKSEAGRRPGGCPLLPIPSCLMQSTGRRPQNAHPDCNILKKIQQRAETLYQIQREYYLKKDSYKSALICETSKVR